MKNKVVKIAIAAVAAISFVFMLDAEYFGETDVVKIADALHFRQATLCHLDRGVELPDGSVTQSVGVFLPCEVHVDTGEVITIAGMTLRERAERLAARGLMYDPYPYVSAGTGVCANVPYDAIENAGNVRLYLAEPTTQVHGSEVNIYTQCYQLWKKGEIHLIDVP